MNDKPTGTAIAEVAPERGKMNARDIRIGAHGINFTNAGEVMAFANMMAQSGFAVRKPFRDNPGACLAVIDDAIRFGVSPYFLSRNAYLVNDQLAYEAKAIAAIIIARAPIKDLPTYEYAGEGVKRKCTVVVETITGKTIRHSSPEVGIIEPKNSPLWKSDVDQQLGYYTIRAMSRLHFPHILAGIYDLEEAAAARAVDITPPSSITDRLPGPKPSDEGEGFDHERIGEEVASTGNGGLDAAVEHAVGKEGDDGFTDDERKIIADATAALEECGTQKEIDVLAGEYANSIATMSEKMAAAIYAAIKARREALAASPKKKAAKKEAAPATLV